MDAHGCLLDCRCDPSTLSVATCGPNHTDNWQWSSDALRCGAHRLSMAELRAPLSKRWVVVAGDSIARFFFAAMLRLLSDDSEQPAHCLQEFASAACYRHSSPHGSPSADWNKPACAGEGS